MDLKYIDEFDYFDNRVCPCCGSDKHLIVDEDDHDFYTCKKCKVHIEMDVFNIIVSEV